MAICIFNWPTLASGNESFTKINSLSEVLLHLVENFTQRFTIGTLTENFIINCFYWQWLGLFPCHSRANVIFRYNKRKLYFAKYIIMESIIYCKLTGWSIYLHVGFACFEQISSQPKRTYLLYWGNKLVEIYLSCMRQRFALHFKNMRVSSQLEHV